MNAFSKRMMSNHVGCSDKRKESRYSCDSNELKRSMTSTGNCRNNELYTSLYELETSHELKTSLHELKTSLTSTRTVR